MAGIVQQFGHEGLVITTLMAGVLLIATSALRRSFRSSTTKAGSISKSGYGARAGLSVASAPRPQAVHAVTNVLVDGANDAEPTVTASFTVLLYEVRAERTHAYFGRYEYGG